MDYGKLLKSAGNAMLESVRETGRKANSAYDSSSNYSDEELYRKFKSASDTGTRAGYMQAMKERRPENFK